MRIGLPEIRINLANLELDSIIARIVEIQGGISMTKVLVSLPDSLGEWAEKEAANNNFDNVGDYVESLLREERERQEASEEFDRLIQEGLDSGISDRTMAEILADAKQQAKDRLNAKL
jgi:antitoxin ParD1/3/4